MSSRRDKSLEREIVDCLQAIRDLPDEFMAQQRTAGRTFGGYFRPTFTAATKTDELMRRVSPFTCLSEDAACYLSSEGRHKKFTVYKIGDYLYRVNTDGAFDARSYWDLELLSNGKWVVVDTYEPNLESKALLVRAWNKRRREALRAVKGQSKEEALREKEAKKLAQITDQKMAAALQATKLRDQINEFLQALEDDTVTHEHCALLCRECGEMSTEQKELRRVMGTRMPKK